MKGDASLTSSGIIYCDMIKMHIPCKEKINLKLHQVWICRTKVQHEFCCSNMRINYRRILQNPIFTNTEQKYMKLLPFERGMFAVS